MSLVIRLVLRSTKGHRESSLLTDKTHLFKLTIEVFGTVPQRPSNLQYQQSITEMHIIALACAVALLIVFTFIWKRHHITSAPVPVSANYHFTRRCNYECGFCFHTTKTSYILPLEDAKKGLLLLKQAGMRKLNFAGGEPFLYPKFIGELAKYCKDDLHIESVSIVTNGSLVKPNFFDSYQSDAIASCKVIC